MNEFQLIKHYFTKQSISRSDVLTGIGDDCALLAPPNHHTLAMTTDTLVSDVHFFKEAKPEEIGHHALAVNLSDLAAMGATPAWVSLALTLPQIDECWLQGFCQGFFKLAEQYAVQLVGGDLTKGPLSITISAVGFVPMHTALHRNKAKPGDFIYVSGTLGNAGAALKQGKMLPAQPRIALGQALLGIAHAAIDISDGLAADLAHILKESHVGAIITTDHIPLAAELLASMPKEQALALALTAGDDYELCFTIPSEHVTQLERRITELPYPITCIGHITETTDFIFQHADGQRYQGDTHGYQHF